MVIDSFDGDFRFLSNFSPHPVFLNGRGWKTAEHAFQAMKTDKTHEKNVIGMAPTPGKAKRLGQRVTLRPDWENIKLDVMLTIVRKKFSQHRDIAELLIGTGDAELIEGNNWNDRFWGVCNGEGENNLGLILMQIRKEVTNAGK